MSEVLFVVLDVGQGSGNFVEIYNGTWGLTTPPDNTILLDLGSSAEKSPAGGPSVDYVYAQLMLMATPKIDLIILSHSDKDHINLIGDLLDKFEKGSKKLTVGVVFYGGSASNYTKGTKNVLNRLAPLTSGGVNSFPPDFSSFQTDDKSVQSRVVGPVTAYMLHANEVKADPPAVAPSPPSGSKRKAGALDSGYALNTVSVVTILEHGSIRHLVTGDATGLTLLACNRVLKLATAQARVQNIFMMTVPHHGSDKTLYDLGNVEKKSKTDSGLSPAKHEVKVFIDTTKPAALSVGATETSRVGWNHPAWEVLNDLKTYAKSSTGTDEYFKGDAGLPTGEHYFRAWFNVNQVATNKPTRAAFYTLRTTQAIFTTDHFGANNEHSLFPPYPGTDQTAPTTGGTPAKGVSWGFATNDAGDRSVVVIKLRAAGVARRAAELRGEAVRPPHHSDFVIEAGPAVDDVPADAGGVRRVRESVSGPPPARPLPLRRLP